jgi:hypothetical protein
MMIMMMSCYDERKRDSGGQTKCSSHTRTRTVVVIDAICWKSFPSFDIMHDATSLSLLVDCYDYYCTSACDVLHVVFKASTNNKGESERQQPVTDGKKNREGGSNEEREREVCVSVIGIDKRF